MIDAVSAIAFSEGSDCATKQSATARRFDLIVVATLAFLLRLAWVCFRAWVAGDSAWYLSTARNLAFHHVFSATAEGGALAPTAFRPPLYSAVIALMWFRESPPVPAVLLLQVVLGAATVALVYLAARDQFGRAIALLAAMGLALAPMTGYFTAVVLSETLFTFLLTTGVFCWGRKRHVVAGLVFGLATLTRVTLLPFIIVLPLLTLVGPWRSLRRAYLTITLLSCAIISIWTVRNAADFHRFIPVAAGGYGTNLFLGTVPLNEADDVPRRKALLSLVDQTAGSTNKDETKMDRVRLRAALSRIAADPRRWLLVRAQQIPRLYLDSGSYVFGDEGLPLRTVIREGRVAQALVRIGFLLINALVFMLALIGIVAERNRFVSLSHLTLFPILLAVISLPLWIEPRYGLPMMPLVAIFSAVGATRIWKGWRRSAQKSDSATDAV